MWHTLFLVKFFFLFKIKRKFIIYVSKTSRTEKSLFGKTQVTDILQMVSYRRPGTDTHPSLACQSLSSSWGDLHCTMQKSLYKKLHSEFAIPSLDYSTFFFFYFLSLQSILQSSRTPSGVIRYWLVLLPFYNWQC